MFTTNILCFGAYQLFAQVFDNGQNPPGIEWKQINTENFQIIYPTLFEQEAQRMANTLQNIIGRVSNTLSKEPRKISIILQNQGTSSNGFVQLAPRRSEFYTVPPQEFDYQDWLNSLAVHELRHVVQFDKLTGNLRAPLFEQLALAIFGVTLPPWFFEGDAVGIETALTHAGRGRLPGWELIFRTNTLSGKKYSYSKDFLGSVKDLTPGYYQLGYFMTTKLRRDYGALILDSVISRISANPLRPYSLSNSIKKYTRLNTRKLHESAVAELERLWQNQLSKTDTTSYPILNNRPAQTPTDYLLPVEISRGKTLVLKQSRDRIPAFVLLDSARNEQKILNIGIQEEPHFSYAAGKIVWDELRYDVRYQKRSYNVINSYDLVKKKYRQLTHKTRLFAPSLSPDGKTIVAVSISLANKIEITEFDAETGIELIRYKNLGNLMLQYPRYDPSGGKIVYVAVSQQGKAIYEINRKTKTATQLLDFQQQLISRPVYAGNYILFSAHYNGLDNLYSLDRESKKITQLTDAKFGAYNPWYNDQTKRILFNNYQVTGHDVAYLDQEKTAGKDIVSVTNTFINYALPLVAQEGNVNVFKDIPSKRYETKPYRELANLFYFHSLLPVVEENNLTDGLNLGFQLLSNNKLNTLDFYAGYNYNYGLKKNEYLAGLSYKRFFPIINLQYNNRARLIFARRTINGVATNIPVSWRENETELNIKVPFLFNRLNYTYNLGFTTGTSYTSRYNFENRINNLPSSLMFPMRYEVNLGRNSRRSSWDLAPRWSQNITVAYRDFPFDTNFDGSIFRLQTLFYTPGIAKNHSFQLSFNYQSNSGIYDRSVDIPRASGSGNLRPNPQLRNSLLLDYRFPLFYPDWEIGPMAYIKRVKAGFFTDFENLGKGNVVKPLTYGLELRADMNLLRFYLPNFDVGGKLIFVNEKPRQKPIFEFGLTYSY